MEALLVWAKSNVNALIGGALIGAVLTLLHARLPGVLAGALGRSITKALGHKDIEPEDMELALAVVKWTEKKVPGPEMGRVKFALAADKIIKLLPFLKGREAQLTALVEKCVVAMKEELRKKSQP